MVIYISIHHIYQIQKLLSLTLDDSCDSFGRSSIQGKRILSLRTCFAAFLAKDLN